MDGSAVAPSPVTEVSRGLVERLYLRQPIHSRWMFLIWDSPRSDAIQVTIEQPVLTITHKNVFVTSQSHNGDFGGLTGADAFCQNLALTAGLSGTYKAWLSDTTGSPATRFAPASVPYRLIDGTTIANDWNDLTDGTIQTPINLDEYGNAVSSSMVFFTMTDGTAGLFQSPPPFMAMTVTATTGPTPMVKDPQHPDLLFVKQLKSMTTGPTTPITMDVVLLDNPSTVLNNDRGHRRTRENLPLGHASNQSGLFGTKHNRNPL